ncbi:MAG: FKBP-type peptidyl-prolyl cis-trans isomerase [Paludibacteraceae bacterium]|nr:FKBP-type peptidyl-prolyl cis-trans isomerase [Paludibacteraceae bacterium]
MINKLNYILSVCLVLLMACQDPAPQVPYNKIPKENPTESLIEMNKEFAAIEDSLIRAYIDSLSLPFTTTKSGLRYYITNQGEGDTISLADQVTFRYSVKLLDGSTCDKLTDVVKTENLGHCDMERGYREALLLMKQSSSGVFVMPSFLAYGVIGVPKCIPAWTPVECTITVIEVKRDR